LLVPGGANRPVAHAATAPAAGAELAPVTAVAPPNSAAPGTAAVAGVSTLPAPEVSDVAPSALMARAPTDRKLMAMAKPGAAAARPRADDVSLKTPRPVAVAAKPKATNAPGRRGIDREFGF
jgi:hypothetical protein